MALCIERVRLLMANWIRKIDVKQYDKLVVPRKKSATLKWDIRNETEDYSNSFSITYPELAFYTGLSVLTRCNEIYSPEVVQFAKSYFLTIPAMLNGKKVGQDVYLALDKENENLLRDFSKSSRTGEIAQGVNYFYFKKYKNVETVYDYKVFCETKGCKAKGYSPDYVLVYDDGTIGLLESKGTAKADPSGCIQHGKEQCDDGQKVLNGYVKNGFVSAVNWATSKNMRRNTTLFIVDPTTDNNHTETNIDRHIRYEYSKLFHYIGEKEIYEALRDDKPIDKKLFEKFEKRGETILLQSIDVYEMGQIGLDRIVQDTKDDDICEEKNEIEIILNEVAMKYLLANSCEEIKEIKGYNNISLTNNLSIQAKER